MTNTDGLILFCTVIILFLGAYRILDLERDLARLRRDLARLRLDLEFLGRAFTRQLDSRTNDIERKLDSIASDVSYVRSQEERDQWRRRSAG